MLNNSKIYRAGYIPRVIFYSQSSKGHEYNYGNPVVTITGKNTRHIPQNTSAERKLFSNIKPHPLPNSRRTILPDYQNPQIKKFNKAKKFTWQNSTMDYTLSETENKKIKSTIKISDKKNKTSDELNYNNKIQRNNNENINKNSYSFYIKNKYDYNSEIINLPGGTKRRINDIKDDLDKNVKEKKYLNSTANCFRKRDFDNSKIDCLNNFDKSKNENIGKNNINLTNKEIYKNNYNTNYDSINYKNQNNIIDRCSLNNNNNNKYKYEKIKKIKRKVLESSKENNESFNNFNHPIKQNSFYRNNIHDSFKDKNNELITHYAKKRNMKSYNKLFNEVHQENSKYNLINYYGNNYSKKNYSQFELK